MRNFILNCVFLAVLLFSTIPSWALKNLSFSSPPEICAEYREKLQDHLFAQEKATPGLLEKLPLIHPQVAILRTVGETCPLFKETGNHPQWCSCQEELQEYPCPEWGNFYVFLASQPIVFCDLHLFSGADPKTPGYPKLIEELEKENEKFSLLASAAFIERNQSIEHPFLPFIGDPWKEMDFGRLATFFLAIAANYFPDISGQVAAFTSLETAYAFGSKVGTSSVCQEIGTHREKTIQLLRTTLERNILFRNLSGLILTLVSFILYKKWKASSATLPDGEMPVHRSDEILHPIESASRFAQFLSFCIDLAFALLVFWLIIGSTVLCEKFVGGLSVDFSMNLGSILLVFHIFLKDIYLWPGQSLGKRIMGIRIIDAVSNRSASKGQLCSRPPLIFGILLFLLAVAEAFSLYLNTLDWKLLPEQFFTLGAAAVFLSIEFGLFFPRKDNRRIIDLIVGTRIIVARKSNSIPENGNHQ
ncbi:MAG: RDD family protein [Candidatus Riflebacteria bacterium]|nr:RDD family protein [Candidatus Riflebacteria bacterium]